MRIVAAVVSLGLVGAGLVTAGAADAASAVPQASRSHYVQGLTGSQTTAQISAAEQQVGCADAKKATTSSPHLTLLEFGAQTAKAGGDGTGTGSSRGVRLVVDPTPAGMRLTDAQVVAAGQGWLAGWSSCRSAKATGPATLAIGTNTDGYEGSSYAPADKGADWATQVVGPLQAAGASAKVTVVGANDIEADFDAQPSEVIAWVKAFVGAGSSRLINNGAASGCPTAPNTTGQACQPVAVDGSNPPETRTWTQAQYAQVSGGIAPSRISVLPQVYVSTQAPQWENIALTAAAAGTPLTFAGVLTQFAVCGASCSYRPAAGWKSMRTALRSSPTTSSYALPALTDIRYG